MHRSLEIRGFLFEKVGLVGAFNVSHLQKKEICFFHNLVKQLLDAGKNWNKIPYLPDVQVATLPWNPKMKKRINASLDCLCHLGFNNVLHILENKMCLRWRDYLLLWQVLLSREQIDFVLTFDLCMYVISTFIRLFQAISASHCSQGPGALSGPSTEQLTNIKV